MLHDAHHLLLFLARDSHAYTLGDTFLSSESHMA